MDGLSGIASGVDTTAIIAKLMQLERQSLTRMSWSQTRVTTQQSALTAVRTKLNTLQNAVAGLRDVGTWADKQTVESSDTRVVAERVAGAPPGGYAIKVLGLARAEQRSYDFTPSDEASSITIGDTTVDLAAGATLEDAVAAINAKSGSPVYAAAVNGQLVLSARTTGTTSAFTATGDALSNEQVKAGVDATFTIDGGPVMTSSSNVVTDAIPGIKLTLKGTTTADAAVTIGVPGLDVAGLKAKMKAFVDAYNDVVKTTRNLVNEERVANPATAAQFAQGGLRNDSGLNAILSRLRSSVADIVDGNPGTMDELRELGVSTGKPTGGTTSADAKAGLLTFDETTFTKALEADPLGARRLLGAGGVEGFAQRLEGVIKGFTGTKGLLSERIDSAGDSLKGLRDRMADEDRRLATREARLKAQFAAMESALGAAQSQQAWLQGQLATLQWGR
jgi:flagellar hook-associated protein 2